MITEKEFEKFPYDKGELDDLKKKVFAVCSYLEQTKGCEKRSKEILNDAFSGDDEGEVGDLLDNACKLLLKHGDKSPGMWADLYGSLFENGVYAFENHYTPKNDEEMVDIVKKCIQEKKRIRTDLPDGAIA